MSGLQFAVVDLETTGFGNNDRVIEIAIVVLDKNFEVIDEYDSLVDPRRDVGRVDIHRIQPSTLTNAPVFEEVAAAAGMRIQDRILVAHNISFEQRMLRNEFEKVGAIFNQGKGFCTLRHTSEKLRVACESRGIALEGHHRALVDARATAKLLKNVFDDDVDISPVEINQLHCDLNPRTLRRDASHTEATETLPRFILNARYPTSDGSVLEYLDALNWVLDDQVVTETERFYLASLATELGLSELELNKAKKNYLHSMVLAAKRDGVITPAEHHQIKKIATLLQVNGFEVPEITETPSFDGSFEDGARVCFTGTAVDSSGKRIEKSELESLAANNGLQPVSSVTKKNCDLVVASDPASTSGKAAKARKYGLPIMSVAEFLAALQR